MNLRKYPDVVRFVNTARKYCDLLESRDCKKELWIEHLLPVLAQLYAGALQLPAVDIENFDRVPGHFDITHKEWEKLWNSLGDYLGEARWYWAYFNPTVPRGSKEEVIVGDLADDLADIYGDIKPGLRAWDEGSDEYIEEVIWNWQGVSFDSHWGVHAVSAMRALHPLTFLRGVSG